MLLKILRAAHLREKKERRVTRGAGKEGKERTSVKSGLAWEQRYFVAMEKNGKKIVPCPKE